MSAFRKNRLMCHMLAEHGLVKMCMGKLTSIHSWKKK